MSSVAQQVADEQLGQLRRDQYCIFVPGQAPLTNAEAAQGIIDEAKILLQLDLQAMGFGVVMQQSKAVESKGEIRDVRKIVRLSRY